MVEVSKQQVKEAVKIIEKTKKEMGKTVVGQKKIIDGLIRALLSGGNVLVEGVPGIAKTLIVRTLSSVTGCNYKRIQFTADLLPADIVGLTAYHKGKGFHVVKGPIFTNFLLADEINRAPPKVQSALLEAMQERQVTLGNHTISLTAPFFVLATENPLESLGVYPLPEAQVDRFLFKLLIVYPLEKEEQVILKQNMTLTPFSDYNVKPTLSRSKINKLQHLTKKIYLSPAIERYIVRLTDATRNPKKYALKLGKYIEWGSSPRASISMFIASKADALMSGKTFVIPQNVKNVALDVLRHRIILNYEGQAEGITTDDVIKEILKRVPVP